MTSGISWNNYSANQIMQMNKMGVEVPEEVLADASKNADTTYETDDQTIREIADIELEEFMNSDQFSDAKLRDQVDLIGDEQEARYKETVETAKAVEEIAEELGTIESAIYDQINLLEPASEDFSEDEKSTDNSSPDYSSAAAKLQSLSQGATSKSNEFKTLNEKAIVSETFANKAGELAEKFIVRRNTIKQAVGIGAGILLGGGLAPTIALTTLGSGLAAIKGKKLEMAENVKDRSEQIVSGSKSYQQVASSNISKIKNLSEKSDTVIKQYQEQQNEVKEEETEEETEEKKDKEIKAEE